VREKVVLWSVCCFCSCFCGCLGSADCVLCGGQADQVVINDLHNIDAAAGEKLLAPAGRGK
jgi:hypothetical protein